MDIAKACVVSAGVPGPVVVAQLIKSDADATICYGVYPIR